jgi:hypothetical protein
VKYRRLIKKKAPSVYGILSFEEEVNKRRNRKTDWKERRCKGIKWKERRV